jgi:hypothetical protein
MKLIRNFEINTNDLSALQESRSFKVSGDDSAIFSLQVKTSTGKFYNFKSKLFETTITSEHRLANQAITGKSYGGSILFPADADGETYTILLSAEPHFDTELLNSLRGNINNTSLEHNPVLYQVDITQVADVVLNFAPTAATAGNYTEASLANVLQVSQSPTVTTPVTSSVSWVIANNTTDGAGFGLVPTLDLRKNEAAIGDGYWRADTTFTIDDTKSDDGGGSTHYNYRIDSISDLEIGMAVVGQNCTLTRVFTGAYNATTPASRNKPQIKLSTGKAFADGAELTVRGHGKNAVEKAIGCSVTFSNFKLTQAPLTTTVRGDSNTSRTQVDINGTYGIGKSDVEGVNTYIEGFGVDNSTDNPIAGISANADAGYLTMTTNQTLIEGTTLNIINCSNSYTITGDITVHRMPTSTKTIYLDLDKILTLGTAS